MTQSIRFTLLSLRDLLISVGPFLVLAISLLVFAYWWLDPNPPKHVILATGPAQSAYEDFGTRYASLLAKDGITVTLLPSEGSADNLRLLREGRADLGFVQGGTDDASTPGDTDLLSLGSLFFGARVAVLSGHGCRRICPLVRVADAVARPSGQCGHTGQRRAPPDGQVT